MHLSAIDRIANALERIAGNLDDVTGACTDGFARLRVLVADDGPEDDE